MKPKISIVVPVYNGEKMLPLCLGSLMNLDYPKQDLEIIIVDNNSKDGSKAIIEKYPVKYLFEEKKGAGHAMNRGIQASSGDFIAFMDHDCIANANWIKNTVNAFTSDNIGGCGGKILVYNPTTFVEQYIQDKNMFSNKKFIQAKINFFPFIQAGNAMYRREIFQEIGLFDSGLFLEDMDISWRVFLAGYQLKYVADAFVYHKAQDSLKGLFIRTFRFFYNASFLFKKYEKILKNLIHETYNEYYRETRSILFKKFCSLAKALFRRRDKELKFLTFTDIISELAIFFGIAFGRIGLIFEGGDIFPLPDDLNCCPNINSHPVRIDKESYLIKNEKVRWWHNEDGITTFNMENVQWPKSCIASLNENACMSKLRPTSRGSLVLASCRLMTGSLQSVSWQRGWAWGVGLSERR